MQILYPPQTSRVLADLAASRAVAFFSATPDAFVADVAVPVDASS